MMRFVDSRALRGSSCIRMQSNINPNKDPEHSNPIFQLHAMY